MEIVKKHILSIICGVVILLAIILAFFPLSGMQAEAQQKLDQRAKLYGELEGLRRKNHDLPILDDKTTEAAKLKGFPTQKAIEKLAEVNEEVAREKGTITKSAEEANKRELLVPGVLPQPLGTTELVYRDRYLKTMLEMPAAMRAGHPPTPEELATIRQNLWKNEYESKIVMRGSAPDPESKAAYEKQFELDVIGLADREKARRAAEISLYLAPDGIQISREITPSSSGISAKVIWYSQLSLWLQQDVMRAVMALNAGKTVIDAPVKQWVKFEMDPMPYRLAPAGTTPTGPVFNETWTGRVCNPVFDVVRFRFIADVRASDVPKVLQEMGRGRFITPINIELVAVDTNVMAASPVNMIYGSEAVARLTMRCEALMLRSWTLPLMPTEVKQKDLAITATPAE